MGKILTTKVKDTKKMIFEILLDQDEAMNIKGYLDRIHVFSEKAADIDSVLIKRGKRGATKYFLIPRDMRHNIRFNSEVTCQRIETKDKILFVYVIDKFQM